MRKPGDNPENFNPRTLKGYDVSVYWDMLQKLNFNPRTLKGYDLPLMKERDGVIDFNPRTLKGYDTIFWRYLVNLVLFQSTYPQGVRLYLPPLSGRPNFISIHVPSRGTTKVIYTVVATPDISIHVPSRGRRERVSGTN